MKKINQSSTSDDSLSKLARCFALLAIIFLVFAQASCKKDVAEQLPEVTSEQVVQTAANTNQANTLDFSGYKWKVRGTTSSAGPGPNSWSSSNAWVDSKGLHLKLTYDSRTKKWNCAQVETVSTFGEGTYQFWIEGRVDKLDKNVVFGLFNYSNNDYYDEMDIEFARWGSNSKPNLNYTVWPRTGTSGNPESKRWTDTKSFSLTGTYSTHRFIRNSSSIKFQSLHGFQDGNMNQFYSSTCNKSSIISTKKMPVLINLWLYQGKPPSNKQEVEIVVKKFSFKK